MEAQFRTSASNKQAVITGSEAAAPVNVQATLFSGGDLPRALVQPARLLNLHMVGSVNRSGVSRELTT